jgi:tetratricopeptide (TPR) repeat protein
MAKTKTKEGKDTSNMIENPDVLVSKTEEFFNQKKNQNVVFGLAGAIALLVVAFMAYQYYIGGRNQEAQEEMFQAVYYFEKDSVGLALNGDGNSYGFLDIADFYSGTEAANLSQFYAGASYLKLGDYQSAIRAFGNFSSSDLLIQARAFALMGDAYMELDDFDNAISSFEKASSQKPNKEFTPIYLTKLAVAQEVAGDLSAAAATYGKIVENYYGSSQYQESKKHKARLDGLLVE